MAQVVLPLDQLDDLEPGDEVDGEENRCIVCKRGRFTGRSVSEPDASLKWAFSLGRGNICNECYRPWRLRVQKTVNVSGLPEHISDPDNHAALLLDVLAYATFRKEGCQRVNATMLTERCKLIKFVLMQMGLPSGPWRVETLERYDRVPKDSSQFCTVFVDGKERLGVFVPVEPNDARKSCPRREHKLPVYLGHSVLRTDVPWEQELLMRGDTKLSRPPTKSKTCHAEVVKVGERVMCPKWKRSGEDKKVIENTWTEELFLGHRKSNFQELNGAKDSVVKARTIDEVLKKKRKIV